VNRLRIVLDTNVLISAALKPQGLPALALHLVALRAVELFVSEAVMAEYREVFSRPKFGHIPPAEVATLLAMIEREANVVTPSEDLTISKHDPDNRFYECAALTNVPPRPRRISSSPATHDTSRKPKARPGSSLPVRCLNSSGHDRGYSLHEAEDLGGP